MVRLDRLTTTDFDETTASVAVVPTGSIEQHGPALPLGTDSIIATDLASELTSRDDVVVAPTIPVGVSPHHRHFGGSLWVNEETFRRYVEEVTRSLARHGIRRVIFVNGHGGNVGALKRVGQRLRAEEVAFAPTWNWWEAVSDEIAERFDAPGGHAGHGETSMLYGVDRDHVRSERLAAAGDGVPDGWGKHVHGADVGFDTIDFSHTGAVGNPTEADPEFGTELRSLALEELEAFISWLCNQDDGTLFDHAMPLHPVE